ncbi:MAG: hypothetical protein AAFX09_00815 [Pseudomonadota bacterium]
MTTKFKALAGAMIAALCFSAVSAAADSVIIGGTVPDGHICEQVWADSGSPEEAAAVFIAALVTLETDPDAARDCIERIVDGRYLNGGAINAELDRHLARLIMSPAIARSYLEFATPDTGYALPGEPPWRILFTRDRRFDLGDGFYQVRVQRSGASADREVRLRRDGQGRYRIYEASDLLVAVGG